MDTELRRIVSVRARPDCRVEITFDGEAPAEVDFSQVVRSGGVFAPMADPAVFAQVALADGGRAICWPGDIDFCADALWLEVHGMTGLAPTRGGAKATRR